MKFTWGQILFGIPNERKVLDNNYFEKISDTEKVWKIFNEVLNSSSKHVEIDFSNCTNISTTGLTILASLGPLCNNDGRKISIELGRNIEWSDKLSKSMSFVERKTKKLKDIPFRIIQDEQSIKNTLNDLKLIEDINILPLEVFNEIYSKLFELCSNACEHGKNSIGAVCNGSFDKQFFTFTVFDFGKGIKGNVNEHLKEKLSTKEALKWAFQSSNSTCQNIECPRGAGFTIIFDFIQKYKGQLIIYTDDIYYSYKNNISYFKKLDFSVKGTLITATINIGGLNE